MMLPIRMGKEIKTGGSYVLDPDTFRTHYHLLGATGSGKTVALLSMLIPILMEPSQKACVPEIVHLRW